MLGIFSRTMRTATRTENWDAPDHWKRPRYPRNAAAMSRDEMEARLRIMKTTGMW